MKKAALILSLAIAIYSCGSNGNGTAQGNDTLSKSPSVIDAETQHPTGVSNQNVISTDTASMNVEKMSDTTGNK